MRSRSLLCLLVVLLAPDLAFALSYEIGGIKIELPGYVERTDPTTNQVAQKRAWSTKRDIAFSAGIVRHKVPGVDFHVAAMLALSAGSKEEYERYAKFLILPPEIPADFYEQMREAFKPDGATEIVRFRQITLAGRPGYQFVTQNRARRILVQTFFLLATDPAEGVQFTFAGESPLLEDKDAFIGWFKS